MYDNIEQMNAMVEQASKRLKEQQSSMTEEKINNSNEDIYAEFRQYEEGGEGQAVYENYEEENNVDADYYTNPELTNGIYEDNELPQLSAYDEPLFPGGPGKSQIQTWKKEWAGYDLYVTEVLNDKFVFRTLNRFEYKQLISLDKVDALQREEIICQTVTLWPENYNWESMSTTKAGIPSTYSSIIMEKSGFTKDYAIQVI